MCGIVIRKLANDVAEFAKYLKCENKTDVTYEPLFLHLWMEFIRNGFFLKGGGGEGELVLHTNK